MYKFINCRNYIIINDLSELNKAKNCDLCRFIIYLKDNKMFIWTKHINKWDREAYTLYDKEKEPDIETTGFEAYTRFYDYCGKEEIEKMKTILNPITIWESYQQMHYANFEYANTKIYKPIFEFDANSSFTYGALQLPNGFELLKEYMLLLYDKKKNTTNKAIKSRYKNLQNYLVGYFARIKEFVHARSDIIYNSNANIKRKINEIVSKNGKVYLSNTDSIVTDEIGAEIMDKYKGDNAGEFKLSSTCDKLFYKSPNAYQLGDKVVYSGVKYFAQKHIDFFNDIYAEEFGELVKGFDFRVYDDETGSYKLCKVQYGTVKVIQYNAIGEEIAQYIYRAEFLKKGE